MSSNIYASGWDLALQQTEMASNRKLKTLQTMPAEGVISSKFGLRRHPITEQVKLHKGIDIAAPAGTAFIAPESGRITFAGAAGSLGLMVEVSTLHGKVLRFGHASKISVNAGDRIHKGSVLGLVGATGLATGAHLHYEVLVDGKNINPEHDGYADTLLAKKRSVQHSDIHNLNVIAKVVKEAKTNARSLMVSRLQPFNPKSFASAPKPIELGKITSYQIASVNYDQFRLTSKDLSQIIKNS